MYDAKRMAVSHQCYGRFLHAAAIVKRDEGVARHWSAMAKLHVRASLYI